MNRGKFGFTDGQATPKHRKKVREIRYCSHIDRCIYQRYAFLINELYDKAVRNTLVDQCAIAYRTNKGLSNIDYAKQAFDFIRQQDACAILVVDFKDFFESVDHAHLKRALCGILDCDRLPPDYYAVFKNSTMYSCWEWKDLVRLRGLEHDHAARKKMNDNDVVLDPEQFRENVKSCVWRNDSGKGIPQGSPLSATLSNVYLLQFDQIIADLVSKNDGLYLRYCDDVIVILPARNSCFEDTLLAAQQFFEVAANYPGIETQEEKTKRFFYTHEMGSPKLVGINSAGDSFDNVARLNYLGFTFDGTSIRIRAKTVSKYYYRMRRKARNAVRHGKGMKNLYALYSGKSKEINGKRSFVDYVQRSEQTMALQDPVSSSIVKHNLEKIAKAVNDFKHNEAS